MKDPPSRLSQSEIYLLICGEYGGTGWSPNEHLEKYDYANGDSAKHVTKNGHLFLNSTIIHVHSSPKSRTMNGLEGIEIFKHESLHDYIF